MKTLIIGSGEVGNHIAQKLIEHEHNVILIEQDPETFKAADDELDAKVVLGNGSSAGVLKDAGVETADNFLALTSDDRTNLLACTVAKALAPKVFTVARIHDQTYLDNSIINYEQVFNIDYLLNPEALAAVQLAKSIRNPGRVAVESFARGQIEVQEVVVARECKLIGKSLQEVGLGENLRIGSVSRDDRVQVPTAETTLDAGDRVTLFGKPDQVTHFRQILDPKSRIPLVRVVLYGGSEISIALVRMLTSHRFRIRIIEPKAETCSQLAEAFPQVTVIRGDATSRRLLEEEQVADCDYFVACTKRDEDNIVTALQASRLGVKHVQLVINKPDYQDLLGEIQSILGVEQIVSLRKASAHELLRYLDRSQVMELFHLKTAQAKILDLRVGEKSKAVGQSIRELPLPKGCLVVALMRDFSAKVPGADDTIAKGDHLAVIVSDEHRREVERLLIK